MKLDLLEFTPGFFERVWGGHALRGELGLAAPADAPIGEAWLISDHPVHDSVVMAGPLAGRTLHSLLEEDEAGLLGSLPRRTRGGRFPLMLKLLDCTEVLSVQVHPDDALSQWLGEEDGGKTEMWYFLGAQRDGEIICGLTDHADAESLVEASQAGSISEMLRRWPVRVGDAALVRAGTVHALGAGLLAAEIQQTSDVTYRLFDWNRVGADGVPRALHIEQAMHCLGLDTVFNGLVTPLEKKAEGAKREVLGACQYFAAERVTLEGGAHACATDGRSFRLLLGLGGEVAVSAGEREATITRGRSVLVAGNANGYTAQGSGMMLDYYVPDLEVDVVAELVAAGMEREKVWAMVQG